jgi:pimeloyl-ACP methyl ester carboxylesterase
MRGFVGFVLGLLLLAATAALCESILEILDRRAHPVRGVFAGAGGFRLRLLPSGDRNPGPTVLLETGIGGATSVTWAWVQHGVERFAPVVSYDRAGLGASEPGPMPRDGRRLVEELHTALANGGIHPPFVFVGHSYGGLLARLYADRYPDEVAGVVLCESSHPGQFHPSRPSTHGPIVRSVVRALPPLAGTAPWLARLGVIRLFVTLVPTDVDRLPSLERGEQKAYLATPAHWVGTVRELAAWGPLTNPETRETRGFGTRPLVVLTAGDNAARWAPWAVMQDEIARLSTDSIHRTVAGATHGSLIADSTHAAVVVESIHEVVDAVRTAKPLRDIAAERGE